MKTRQAAYEAVHGIYCKRVCGMDPAGSHATYTGSMDLLAFVESCPAPSTSDIESHRACWDEMRRMFHVAWSEHETLVEIGRAA